MLPRSSGSFLAAAAIGPLRAPRAVATESGITGPRTPASRAPVARFATTAGVATIVVVSAETATATRTAGITGTTARPPAVTGALATAKAGVGPGRIAPERLPAIVLFRHGGSLSRLPDRINRARWQYGRTADNGGIVLTPSLRAISP